jgi:molybdopterin biosynthesis enzyme
MMAADDEQKIARFTPLTQALAAIDALTGPVTPREVEIGDSIGRVLAADVVASKLPPRAVALQDGWAVAADDLADAGGYAPAQLARRPLRIESGDEMPAGTDAVAPPETIVTRGAVVEAVEAVTAGEGVTPAGSEADPSKPLRKAGERVGPVDAAVFMAADIASVSVRAPRLRVVLAREDLRLMPPLHLIARDCAARGGTAMVRNGIELEDALAADDCDAVIIVGGSGSGRRDRSVRALSQVGTVAVHGVGLMPGETAAIGEVGTRPVLIVPGRLDAALAVWLTLGRRLLARLSGCIGPERAAMLTLSRKVTSTVGLAELVPVRRDGPDVEPLAGGHLPLWALARADGWLLVPAESEGYPAGATVAVNVWPGT